ncbi:hypothetical protein [Stenotrophomonas phage StenR_269]|nr:hypothetical protein [Stenotrophomonas phage StenR_269]
MLIAAIIIVFFIGYLAVYNWYLFLAVISKTKVSNWLPSALFGGTALAFLFYYFT